MGRGAPQSSKGHTDLVTYAALSPDGSRALTASDDTTAKLWDLTTGAVLTSLAV